VRSSATSRFVLYRVDSVSLGRTDQTCRPLIARLFEEVKDSVQIIKWKEIFEVIETAVDKAKTFPT
jgi:hypothetical protein